MFLTTTSHILELVLGAAVAANQVQFYVAYSDHTSSSFTPGATSGTSNSTTPVTLVSAPGSSTQRQINYISIYNNDTANVTATIRNDDGTNERIIVKITIQPGETLEYSYQYGWQVITSGGLIKSSPLTQLIGWPVTDFYGMYSGGIASAGTPTNNTCAAIYMGRVTKAYTSASIRYRITTAGVNITWAEAAIATGSIAVHGQLGQNVFLTVRGFADISGDVTSLGNKTATVSISGLSANEDVFVLLGHQNSTTSPQFRTTSISHNLLLGKQFDSPSATRPSTMIGGTEFTISAGVSFWPAVAFS